MKKIIGLLTLAIMSTSASAIQLEFEGIFSSATGTLQSGDGFSGVFSFDLENPDSSNADVANQELHLDYWTNANAFVISDVEEVASNYVELNFRNNDLGITPDEISAHGFAGLITPDVYDSVFLTGTTEGVVFDDITDDLLDGIEFTLIALYEANTFEQSGFDYAAITQYTPVFVGLEVNAMDNGSLLFHGAGTATVSAVPVPAAFWLFGSALAGLAVRARR